MANNRMYLVYRPSGRAIYLGKNMGMGWYDVPDNLVERMRELFDKAYDDALDGEHSLDDFCVAMENSDGEPFVLVDWDWIRDDGRTQIFRIKEGEADGP